MAKIWKNRASLSSHNISQNLHRYFTLYGISCWWATCSWVGATLSSFMPFINSFTRATSLHTRIGFLVATYLPFFENRSFDFEFWNVNADKKMLRNVQFEVHRNFITSWKLVLQYSIFKKVIGLLMFWIYKAVRLNEALKIINSRKACVCPKFHFQLVTNLPQIY